MNNFTRNTRHNVIAIVLIVMTALQPTAHATNYQYLEVAKQCKKYIVNNSYHYSQKCSREYPLNQKNGKGIDCSGFVSWTIYEYQNGFFEYRTSKWFLSTAKKLYNHEKSDLPLYTRGWEGIKGAKNFMPGDILCYSGHVHIYYGIDYNERDHYLVLNTGNDKAIKEVTTSISGSRFREAKYAIRLPS